MLPLNSSIRFLKNETTKEYAEATLKKPVFPEVGYGLEAMIFKIKNLNENENKDQVIPGIVSGNDKLKKGIITEVVKNAKMTPEGMATLPTVPTRPEPDKKETPNRKPSSKKPTKRN